MRLFGKLLNRFLLWRLRRNEYESEELRFFFKKNYQIAVGLYSYGCFDRWRIPPGTTIGRYCSFAKTVRILDANHPIDAVSTHPYFYDAKFGLIEKDRVVKFNTVIEDDVWLSHNVTVTPGCKLIGRGAILGAGTVVTKDVPPYAIVGGVPATILRYRFDQKTIERIEESRWWELSKADLALFIKERAGFAFHPAIN